ncbi:hypothetical protein ACJIZ3_001081 [Penstemon smallii]|uniref:Cx9C motif-containing protein 4 n=1 Tax=Penstemon smallii TaxID=265156 RepID=A0ABD3U651_9LAMI
MAQPSKEPCKKQACDIQACLSKNNFLPQNLKFRADCEILGCIKVIQLLQSCCEECEYKSTHYNKVDLTGFRLNAFMSLITEKFIIYLIKLHKREKLQKRCKVYISSAANYGKSNM